MAEGETVQNIYDEIEIDDMDFEEGKFYYPCPCGDKFFITLVRRAGAAVVCRRTRSPGRSRPGPRRL